MSSVDAADKLARAEQAAAGLLPDTTLELARRFFAHPTDDHQNQRMANVRMLALQLATAIVENVPQSRERSTALTDLEKVVFMANAGIARPLAATSL